MLRNFRVALRDLLVGLRDLLYVAVFCVILPCVARLVYRSVDLSTALHNARCGANFGHCGRLAITTVILLRCRNFLTARDVRYHITQDRGAESF